MCELVLGLGAPLLGNAPRLVGQVGPLQGSSCFLLLNLGVELGLRRAKRDCAHFFMKKGGRRASQRNEWNNVSLVVARILVVIKARSLTSSRPRLLSIWTSWIF